MNIIEKVKKTIKKFKMLSKEDRILIGVSGGPDSVCLFYLLYQMRKDWNLGLHLGHLNHKLRGKESDEDAEFVKSLAEKFKVSFHYGEVDVREEVRKRGLSLEEGARLLRYEFFSQTAEKNGIKKIALGHTCDDQIETFLMRLIKGAGLLGLKGIPPVREEKKIIIIRPLLEIWKEEIIKYLEKERIDYRVDRTNLSSVFFRNRIRNELIPYLKDKFNPQIKEVLANTAENLGLAYEYINKQGRRKFNSVVVETGEAIIDLDKFKTFHPILQREIFRLVIKELKGNLRRINYQHWKEFEELFQERPTGSILDLPKNMYVKKEKKHLVFCLRIEN